MHQLPALASIQGRKVCTTKQLAKFYGCDENSLHQNFVRNMQRFEEGKHFIRVAGSALREFKESLTDNKSFSPNARIILVWTEKGAARHAKMLSTDRAWDVFEEMEDTYFAVTGMRRAVELRQPRLPSRTPLPDCSLTHERSLNILMLSLALGTVPPCIKRNAQATGRGILSFPKNGSGHFSGFAIFCNYAGYPAQFFFQYRVGLHPGKLLLPIKIEKSAVCHCHALGI